QIMATLREPVAIPAAESYAALPAPQQPVMVQPLPTAAPALAVESNAPEPFAQPRMRSSNRGVFDYVAEQVRREPAQSTRLLEAWIASGEESK
ncbi:MAG: hypothetical protein KGK08_14365, partial [Acidobacteriota bacterium]|nr:hypothetical protein [Acidobacteriota bacterium]